MPKDITNYIFYNGKKKYEIINKNNISELFINDKYIHTIQKTLTKKEMKAHIKLAIETFDFNYCDPDS